MIITKDTSDAHYQIQAYSPGNSITVNNKKHTKSLIISADLLITDWEPQSLAEIKHRHWKTVIDLKPEILLLGTGKTFKIPTSQLLTPLYNHQIGVECMDTGAACRTYVALSAESRHVVAVLLIE